ncbi:hypothetical protein, partial [Microbacterium sp. GXF6406]
MMLTKNQIQALERYRMNADLIRQAFHDHWNANPDPLSNGRGRGNPDDPEFFAWMSLWYSSLFALWEGCIDADLATDQMPNHDNDFFESLKRFRNKTFHVQNRFPHDMLLEHVKRDDSVSRAYYLSDWLSGSSDIRWGSWGEAAGGEEHAEAVVVA